MNRRRGGSFFVRPLGLVPTRPGSIFAHIAEIPMANWQGVYVGVILAAAVSLLVEQALVDPGCSTGRPRRAKQMRFRLHEGAPLPRTDVRVEDADEPCVGPGELEQRVRNCSTRGMDVKTYRRGHHHIRPPRIMGHEIAGEVCDVGDGVSGPELRPGLRGPPPADSGRRSQRPALTPARPRWPERRP